MSTDPLTTSPGALERGAKDGLVLGSSEQIDHLRISLEKLDRHLLEVDRVLLDSGSTQQALEHLTRAGQAVGKGWTVRLAKQAGQPIKRGEETLGYLQVDGAVEPELLRILVREAAHLLERGQRESRKEEELARLNRSGEMISSRLDLESTLQTILQMALEVTGARYGIFRLVNEAQDHLVTAAVAGEQLDRPLVEALPLRGDHIMGWVAENRRSVRIDDLRVPPWSELYFPLDQQLDMRSELAAPLLGANGRLEGVLNMESPELGAFTKGDQLLLETFAGQAVVAIQQARLLDALQEISSQLLAWPCQKVLQRVVELVSVLINARGVRLEFPQGCLEKGQAQGSQLSVELEDMGCLTAFLESPGEWEHKVLACLAHHAVLALKNEDRLEELKVSQQRQAVTETFAAVGDLSANLLHQLNNKVGVIPVRVEGITDKCAEVVNATPYLQRNLKEIEASAQRALEIVRQNMSILRPRPTGAVNLGQCLERAVRELQLGVPVHRELKVPEIEGDFRSLTLVFLNLLENAARAMKNKGEISVRGFRQPGRIVVEIADQGPGIPPERHASVFEFSSDRSRPHGLGFGLWWVRTVMERMGGSIGLESDGVNGTTFRLEFKAP